MSILCTNSFSQNVKQRKKIKATRISIAPKIDGILNDSAWKNAESCTDFVTLRPSNGKSVPSEYQTEVKVVYGNEAIYIAAKMKDPNPKEIPREFVIRDNFGIVDFFLVAINPNDDGQNPFVFSVQATGNQTDSKVSNGNPDFNWNEVWNSDVSIDEEGWNVEIEIPYRALRFANRPVQSWGFNFLRRLEKLNEQHTWNHVDNSIGRWTQHDGLIEDFRDIKPPIRLNLYPYISSTISDIDDKTSFDWSVGMDIKYGITENFTLDATTIPDFSQVAFDNVILNLGPFEQQFAEQRQFFNEGTELFNIGDLFYSRRIGGEPIDQFEVEESLLDDEEVIDLPAKVNMINAVKVSGRTKNGLGVGFFNAITEKTNATIKNKKTDKIREEVVSPFTNYNIMVLDKQFNRNSTISLINTNVVRDGKFRDANATALVWHVETKNSKYNVDGSLKMTSISDDKDNPNLGWAFDNSFGYNLGHWSWQVGYGFENKDFNPNDLGILFRNDRQSFYGNVSWRTLQPTEHFNYYKISYYSRARLQHYSGVFTGYYTGFNFEAQTKNRFTFGGRFNYGTKTKDFFEPREDTTSGIYFLQPERKNISFWASTNSQKKFSIESRAWYSEFSNNPKNGHGFRITPRYRFTNKFSLQYQFNYVNINNDQGYVDKVDEDIIIGIRNRKNYTNTITSKYSFNTFSTLSLRFRHYWSTINYSGFYNLNKDGGLDQNVNFNDDNVNFNNWNLDLNYIWQFAPGCQLIVFYRNSISEENTDSNLSFFNNLSNLLKTSKDNTFSLRFVYFLDYNKLKKIF